MRRIAISPFSLGICGSCENRLNMATKLQALEAEMDGS